MFIVSVAVCEDSYIFFDEYFIKIGRNDYLCDAFIEKESIFAMCRSLSVRIWERFIFCCACCQ